MGDGPLQKGRKNMTLLVDDSESGVCNHDKITERGGPSTQEQLYLRQCQCTSKSLAVAKTHQRNVLTQVSNQ